MDWKTLYCPNRSCQYYGVAFHEGVLVKNGSSHGQRQALCRVCGTSVTVRYGTAYWDLNADRLALSSGKTSPCASTIGA